ncbi:MAG: Na+/H+ antiporter NhaA [Gemmatimonadota bacterium]|nr:Na+/H+ antiporter NhaA [Gemmatimonadota bacterium]
MAFRTGLTRIPSPLGAFRQFARLEASGGLLLLVATIIAFAWANSPWLETYEGLRDTKVTFGWGEQALSKSALHWINDGLMALFFFVVGLEIKRELIAGELAAPRKAALPMAAAVGGMVVPAGIYVALNAGGEAAAGWGVPMATDIAFALAVLTVLGDRVPASLKVFLTAVAIVDDLGAILVIALFYSSGIAWGWLALGGALLVVCVILNVAEIRNPLAYAVPGVVIWLAFYESGVHATVAGVLLAMTIPARTRIDDLDFLSRSRALLADYGHATEEPDLAMSTHEQQEALHKLEEAIEHASSPLQRLEHDLHPWVTYLILPLFAFANAGVEVEPGVVSALFEPIGLGIILGLVLGKQVGVTLFAWIAVRTGIAALPGDLQYREIYGAGWLAGIGFTMSLFIAGLAFGPGEMLEAAKLAILCASLVSGVVGWALLRRWADR